VKGFYNMGIQGTLKITLEDGTTTCCTPHHRWYTQRGWVRADELTEDDSILQVDGTSRYYTENRDASFPSCVVP
jgi:intein/homing endonuclease